MFNNNVQHNYVHGKRRAYHFPRCIILLEMPAEEAMLNALKPNQVPHLGFNHIVSKKLKIVKLCLKSILYVAISLH